MKLGGTVRTIRHCELIVKGGNGRGCTASCTGIRDGCRHSVLLDGPFHGEVGHRSDTSVLDPACSRRALLVGRHTAFRSDRIVKPIEQDRSARRQGWINDGHVDRANAIWYHYAEARAGSSGRGLFAQGRRAEHQDRQKRAGSGVWGEVKNTGDRSLKEVELTI